MSRWTAGAVLLMLAALVAGCGGNSTTAGITITASSTTTGANSVTVPINGTEQFAAAVTGVADTTVYWQVCLPAPVSNLHIPTVCTAVPNVTPRPGTTVLTGYGSISQLGFYTAPSAIPNVNSFVVLATSPVDLQAFATFTITIDSGVRVQVTPTTATIGAGETQQFTATVTGTSNTSVTWDVNGKAGGDINNGGTISTSGLYTAPPTGTSSVTIKAVSGADGTTSGTATVTIVSAAPTLTSVEPQVTEQGAAQQEVYLTGTNFTSNGTVLVNGNSVPFVYLTTTLIRAIIPASALNSSGALPIAFQLQPIPPQVGETSNTQNLTVVPVRPSIVAVSPQSFIATGSTSNVSLTGGFFLQGASAKTTVQFDAGNEGAVVLSTIDTAHSSQRLGVTLPANALNTPGLYALTAQNPGIAAGQPSMSSVNIGVTPSTLVSTVTGVPTSISLGGSTQPSAIAMDLADGIAVVAEQGTNSVALVNVASGTVVATIPVGKAPTGVAVDDLLPHPLALVVNSGDNTVSVIDLKTMAPAAAPTSPLISLAGFTPSTTYPVSVGINPQTHRAIVANASTNLATVIDLVNQNTNIDPACTTPPCPLMVLGGTATSFSTGASPGIGIDPSLNWAVVTPGGAGSINIVDLGFGSPNPGSNGRAPAVLGSLSLSTAVQGVGINPETHQALFTDFASGNVTTYSLLDNTVNSVNNFGVALALPKESAAAVNPLQDIGIAINSEGTGTASVVDIANHNVLQTVTNVTGQNGAPSAVAMDPATNEALITNSAAGTISVIPLGLSNPKQLQILESSPAISFTSSSALSLTINGMGFGAGSAVLLDGTPLSGATVVSSRQIQVSVPATKLVSARRFAVQVQNTVGSAVTVSNVEPLTIVQAISVGTAPAGVAIDSDRDLAVVTNSASGNVSLVSIAPPSNASPQSLGPVGVIGTPLPAHLNPRAVAVDPLVGLAVAANFDSNDLSLIDYSEINVATPTYLPAVLGCSPTAVCTGPAGIAFNQDTDAFLVSDSNIGTTNSDVAFGAVSAATPTTPAAIGSPGVPQPVDQTPGDLAIAPSFDPFDPVNNPNPSLTYAAVASSAQTSVVDFLDTSTQLVVGRTTGVVQPTGVVYDSLNNVFLVSDSLNNNILVINPLTFVPVTFRGGFNPSSIAYNSQTSTIVAVNGATGTLSVLDYLCPPLTSTPACTAPQVRSTIGLVGSQVSPTAPLGPKTVDIDQLTGLAVLVDSENNRVLLIPLPN
jgi:YVTN family beta-propeller protein